MAEAFLEITEWGEHSVPNGTYLLEGDKCLAFRNHKGKTFYFDKPLQIDKRYRQFQKLTKSPFKVKGNDPDVVQVIGSKGDVYYVNQRERTCTCPGFTFRGRCNHVKG